MTVHASVCIAFSELFFLQSYVCSILFSISQTIQWVCTVFDRCYAVLFELPVHQDHIMRSDNLIFTQTLFQS